MPIARLSAIPVLMAGVLLVACHDDESVITAPELAQEDPVATTEGIGAQHQSNEGGLLSELAVVLPPGETQQWLIRLNPRSP